MEKAISISNDDRIAMAEVDYIIHHMNELYLNKIPQKIKDCITLLKKDNIEIYVDPKIPLDEQGLKEYTLYFLMILNLKYWCNDERRRDILAMMDKNQKAYDERVNDVFKHAESLQTTSEYNGNEFEQNRPRQIIIANNANQLDENTQEKHVQEIVETKDEEIKKEDSIAESPKNNFFIKFINKIKSFFKSKK